jgi:ubiquinol-cytochrome c reductase cytochrome c subunit
VALGSALVMLPLQATARVSAGAARPAVQAAPDDSRGAQLYGASCAGCHGQQGAGTQQGPSLLSAGAADTDFQLTTGRMPLAHPESEPARGKPAFDAADIRALDEYVASLGSGPAIPAVPAGDARRGWTLFISDCASCHGSSGVGGALPGGWVAPSVLQSTRQQVAEAVRVGPGLMPPFSDKALTDQQVGDIATYIRSLPSHESHGGWSIGSVGPVTEGMVGWFVGAGVLVLMLVWLGRRAP